MGIIPSHKLCNKNFTRPSIHLALNSAPILFEFKQLSSQAIPQSASSVSNPAYADFSGNVFLMEW